MRELDDLPAVKAFGTWDAPLTDDAEWIAVPTKLVCVHCGERFRVGDNGAVMPNGFAEHRECGLRAVVGGIGHLVAHDRYCHGGLGLGPDAGLPYRISAQLVWAQYHGTAVTEAELKRWREVVT